jgi:CHAD domain-containing protein
MRQNDRMLESQTEREDKYDVAGGFVMPDLTALVPAGGQVVTASQELRSAYFDTAEHDLRNAGLTFRRRTGSTDTGWHLKVPAGAARTEVRHELTAEGTVPVEFGELLLGITRGRPLLQVAVLTTARTTHRVLAADGTPLAEIADDTVRASASSPYPTVAGSAVTASSLLASTWREVEVELLHADESVLRAAGKLLRRAGAEPAGTGSKLARALGPNATPPALGRKPRAGQIVAAYLAEQERVILAGDLAIRRDDEQVVHATRVATRRLRSTLRVFAPLFSGEQATRLDGELAWFANLLGEVRDRQVLRARMEELIDGLDESLVLGPVRRRVDETLLAEQAEYWHLLRADLVGSRYLELLDEVHSWVAAPPWTAQAHDRADTLVGLVDKAQDKVAHRLTVAQRTGDLDELHGARKAAKRARYAAELAEPVLGRKRAKAVASRYETLQDQLGEHQDSVLGAQLLYRLALATAGREDENGFTFGLLYQRELHRSEAARDQARKTARKHS